MNEAIRMQVSAFVDGELPDNEADLLVRRLSQDRALRQQVAEYVAIGRVMRGEYGVQGIDTLRERIAAELDERPLQEPADVVATPQRARYLRPLAGFAIAASVALVAILGLRQTMSVDTGPNGTPPVVMQSVAETVPTISADDELRQYLLLHSETSNGLNARLTAAEIQGSELDDEGTDADAVDATGETEAVTSQP